MASVADVRARFARDHLFFFSIAVAMTVTVIAGFGFHLMTVPIDFPHLPVWVHFHALVFASWMALYTWQNWLILQGDVRMHRRLGWVGVALAPAVVVMGAVTSVMAIALHRQPPFFTPAFFLALDMLSLIAFAGLVTAAILMRRRTEWHRRLMLCATIILINPAWGRLVPLPIVGQVIGQWMIFAALMLYAIWAMVHDLRTRGHVHPAYYWGVGTIVAWQVLIQPLSLTPPVQALAHALTA